MLENEYAEAIYELADENGCIDNYSEYFLELKEVDETEEFVNFFTNPTIAKSKKKAVLKNTFKNFDKTFLNFLYVLVDNGRINLIKKIGKRYSKMVLENKNIVKVKVFSALALTKKEMDVLDTSLEMKYKGKQVEIKNVIDNNLIAGYRVVVNNEAIELNLKNSLDQMKKSL